MLHSPDLKPEGSQINQFGEAKMMKRPEEPLVWPAHFPPTEPVKKFFIGLRWLGPDLRFFKDLRKQQAGRIADHMAVWPTDEERDMALLMGKHFRHSIAWRTEFFLPPDHFKVIAYGPRFQSMDDMLFEEASLGIETDIGLKLADAFWQETIGWSFEDVVKAVIKKRKGGAPQHA